MICVLLNTKVEIKGFPARCFRDVDPDSETDDPFKPKREEEESEEEEDTLTTLP